MRKNNFYALGLVLCSALLFSPGNVRANEKVYNKLVPSTTWIVAELGNGQASYGSGVLVNAQKKWVLTNRHVVRDNSEVTVFFPVVKDGSAVVEKGYYIREATKLKVPGRVIARDPKRDLAVIELSFLPPGAKAVPLAASSAQAGQVLHSIGNPITEPALWLYSHGKARQVYPKQIASKTSDGFQAMIDCKLLLSTIPVNPGDSGGPGVNDQGELVGLVSGFVVGSTQMSFLIDISEICTVLSQAETAPVAQVPPVVNPAQSQTSGPIVAVKQQPEHSLLGTWKASTVNPKGTTVNVTMTVNAQDLKVVLLPADNSQPPITIAGPYTVSNNQVNINNQGRWENLGLITWIDANSFDFQDALVKLQFKKAR